MIKKRLVGVVTVRNGWAVQSISYNRYLPLGKPECLVENLDRWGADEIVVLVIDRSARNLGPDFQLLERLARLGLSTPLIYGGGIRSAEDGVRAIQAGADRLVVDALLHDNPAMVRYLSAQLGAQAIIAALPMARSGAASQWLDYRARTSTALSETIKQMLTSGVMSEALLIDWQHEGTRCGFDHDLIARFSLLDVPLIAFGGITDIGQITKILQHKQVAAVAIGNSLNYREHAIQELKVALSTAPLRLPTYEAKYSSFQND